MELALGIWNCWRRVLFIFYIFSDINQKQDTFCWSCNVAALRICRDEATRLCCSALRICRCWNSCEYMWVSVFRGGSSVQELLVASMATQDGCLLSPPTNSIATGTPEVFNHPQATGSWYQRGCILILVTTVWECVISNIRFKRLAHNSTTAILNQN